jgi:ASC-1-like (ASCH) protein
MAQIHELKILPEYYKAVKKGVKTYELRFDDRNYAVGDMLILREWKDGQYTGQQIAVTITHVLKDFIGLMDGWAILSIKKVGGKKCLKKQ